jgi:hypothetical protein
MGSALPKINQPWKKHGSKPVLYLFHLPINVGIVIGIGIGIGIAIAIAIGYRHFSLDFRCSTAIAIPIAMPIYWE